MIEPDARSTAPPDAPATPEDVAPETDPAATVEEYEPADPDPEVPLGRDEHAAAMPEPGQWAEEEERPEEGGSA